MRKTIAIASIIITTAALCCQTARAQTNTPQSVLDMFTSYLKDNDPNYNGWCSNHFDIWEAAAFQNVNGTPGASAVGNVLGLEIPVWRSVTKSVGLHLESQTDFETVFGDVGYQAVGIGYDYNLHQIQLSAGLDADIGLNGPLTVNAVPFIEFKKASTSLGGASPIFRYELPIRSHPGGGRLLIGVQVPL